MQNVTELDLAVLPIEKPEFAAEQRRLVLVDDARQRVDGREAARHRDDERQRNRAHRERDEGRLEGADRFAEMRVDRRLGGHARARRDRQHERGVPVHGGEFARRSDGPAQRWLPQ